MGDRAVYCARLESVCAERHPGFESPPIRHEHEFALTNRIRKILTWRFLQVLFFLSAVSLNAAEPTTFQTAALLEAAKNSIRAGKLDAALATLDQIDKTGKGNVDSLDLRGTIYLEQGRLGDAKSAFHAASELDHARFSPRLHLGDVLLREKKFAEARETYGRLLDETNVQVLSEKLRYAILLTYLFAHDESRARMTLNQLKFPTESPAYYYSRAAWEFAHDHGKEGEEWLKAAEKMFDEKSNGWFARPLFDFGWLKNKPAQLELQ